MVRICHAMGVTVEGELGHVGDNEGVGKLENPSDYYTDPAVAADFVRNTGVDALAVAVGNAHGDYKFPPKLDFERITAIREATRTPLVLHGGSGLSDDDFANAIRRGIAKVNIHTDMVCAGMRAMYEQCDAHNRDKIVTWDYLDTRKSKVEAIKAVVARKLQLFNSVGRA
jgi:fructose-bisphosphate aldolase class II